MFLNFRELAIVARCDRHGQTGPPNRIYGDREYSACQPRSDRSICASLLAPERSIGMFCTSGEANYAPCFYQSDLTVSAASAETMQRPPQQSKYFEHDLADMRAAFHQSMGFGCLLKRESLVNDWLDAPCLEQRPNVLAQIGRNLSLEGNRARTQSRAGDRQAPSEHLAKVNSVFRAAQQSNNDNSAIVRLAADFAHDVFPGDHIQNHINAPACRGLLNDLHKIFVAVIEAPLRSKLFACAAFLIQTSRRKIPMTESSGELIGGYADAGSSALHQQRLPLAQLSAVEYVAPYGKVRLGQGRAFDGAKHFRQRQALRQGGGAIFCVSATLHQRANHVPLLKAAF